MKKFVLPILIACVLLATSLVVVGCGKGDAVVGIEINTMPNKVNYYVGEDLDVTGSSLSVIHANGKVDVVSLMHGMISRFDSSSLGRKTLVVTYKSGNTEYTTTMVVNVVPREPESMSIKNAPANNRFVAGSRIDLTGLTVEITYTAAQGQAPLVVERGLESLTINDTIAHEGQTSVRVFFDTIYLDVPIVIVDREPVGATVRLQDGFVLWQYGVLSYQGLAVDIVYNDGTTSPATYASVDEIGDVLGTPGAKTVHATCGKGDFECRAQGVLTVQPDQVTDLEIVEYPALVEENVPFQLKGVKVRITTEHNVLLYDASTGVINLGCVPALDSVPHSGDLTVVLTLDEHSASFETTVGPNVVVALEATQEEYITTYSVGETPVLNRLELYAVYADGSRLLVWKSGHAQVEGVTRGAVQAGDTEYAVTYQGVSYSYAITVVD